MDILEHRISGLNDEPLASSVTFDSTPRVLLRGEHPDRPIKRCPDSSLRHVSATYPSLVIEKSYSQKHEDLEDLAEDYIIGSHGNIRMVIALGIEYPGSKMATVSVWQPEEGVTDGVPFLAARQVTNCRVCAAPDAHCGSF